MPAVADATASRDPNADPGATTVADSSDSTANPTFTLDSEISPLLPKWSINLPTLIGALPLTAVVKTDPEVDLSALEDVDVGVDQVE